MSTLFKETALARLADTSRHVDRSRFETLRVAQGKTMVKIIIAFFRFAELRVFDDDDDITK